MFGTSIFVLIERLIYCVFYWNVQPYYNCSSDNKMLHYFLNEFIQLFLHRYIHCLQERKHYDLYA